MCHSLIRKITTASAMVALAPFATMSIAHADATGVAPVEAMTISDQDLADKELKSRDWSKAEAALLNSDISDEDQVFAKLNLAFVYSSTGRKDLAVAIYNDILSAKENPYAMTRSGQPRRVKTIAKMALTRLDQ